MWPSLLLGLGVLALTSGCKHTPRVVVPMDCPARIEGFDRATGQAEVIILGKDGPMKGWMPMDELKGRTVILDDDWLK